MKARHVPALRRFRSKPFSHSVWYKKAVRSLQRPLADGALKIVATGERKDEAA